MGIPKKGLAIAAVEGNRILGTMAEGLGAGGLGDRALPLGALPEGIR